MERRVKKVLIGIIRGLVSIVCIGCNSFFTEISPKAYGEAFWSFSFFYCIGAGAFYILEKRNVRKQNKVKGLYKIKSRDLF